LLVGNALIVPQSFAGFVQRFPFFGSKRLVAHWCIGDGAGNWVEHGFEEAANRTHLTRRKTVDQLVNRLLVNTFCLKEKGGDSKSLPPRDSLQAAYLTYIQDATRKARWTSIGNVSLRNRAAG